MSVSVPDTPSCGRNETDLERCDRNLVELLQEVRVVQTGVQVLFAFLLMAPLTPVFHHLGGRQRAEYYLTFVLAGLAAFLLIAPTAYHRILFRRGDKEYLVITANRLTIAGLYAVGISMAGATIFVTDLLFGPIAGLAAGVVAAAIALVLWVLLPVARRRQLSQLPPAADATASADAVSTAAPPAERMRRGYAVATLMLGRKDASRPMQATLRSPNSRP